MEESPKMKKLKGLEETDPAFEPTLSKFWPEAKRDCVAAIDAKSSGK